GLDKRRRRIIAPLVQNVQGGQRQRLSLKAQAIPSQIEVSLVPVRSEWRQGVFRAEERLNRFRPQTDQRITGLDEKRGSQIAQCDDIFRQRRGALLRESRRSRRLPCARRTNQSNRPAINRNSAGVQTSHPAQSQEESKDRAEQIGRRILKGEILRPGRPDFVSGLGQKKFRAVAVAEPKAASVSDLPHF